MQINRVENEKMTHFNSVCCMLRKAEEMDKWNIDVLKPKGKGRLENSEINPK